MLHDLLNAIKEHPAVLWVFIPIVALNIWLDYYHPGGIVLDVIIVVALLVGCGRNKA